MLNEIKATEEIAKTTGKLIDVGQKFSGFISKYTGGPIEQAIGIFEDKLKYMRWERQQRLILKAQEFIQKNGLQSPNKSLPLKYAIPLFVAASLEDNDYLQDMWAKLLINSTDKDSGIDLHRIYIDILERLSPLEACILEKIYEIPYEQMQHNGVLTYKLPDQAIVNFNSEDPKTKIINKKVLLALVNLAKLNCISPGLSMGGGQLFRRLNPTLLGKYFVEACTLK